MAAHRLQLFLRRRSTCANAAQSTGQLVVRSPERDHDGSALHEPTACRQVARGRRSSCDTATLFHGMKSRRATLHQLFGLGHLCSQLTRDAVLRDTMSHRTAPPSPRTRCVVWSCVTQRRTVPHPLPIPACDAAWPCVMPPRTTPINNMT